MGGNIIPSELRTRRNVPGRLSQPIQQYVVGLLLLLVVPIVPFGVEIAVTGDVSATTLCIGGAVYVVSLGAASRSLLYFVMSLLIGFGYCILFGIVSQAHPANTPAAGIAAATPSLVAFSSLVLMLVCALERYQRHVVESAPFPDFMKRSEEEQ